MANLISIALGNMTPAAQLPFRPGNLALVCEGGGQRSLFPAGVLGESMRARFNPFDMLSCPSVGVQNLLAFICEQQGYVLRVNTRYTTRSQFFSPVASALAGEGIVADHALNDDDDNDTGSLA